MSRSGRAFANYDGSFNALEIMARAPGQHREGDVVTNEVSTALVGTRL